MSPHNMNVKAISLWRKRSEICKIFRAINKRLKKSPYYLVENILYVKYIAVLYAKEGMGGFLWNF